MNKTSLGAPELTILDLSLSLYERCSSPLIIIVDLHWIHSSTSLFLQWCRAQKWTPDMSHQCWAERKDQPLWPSVNSESNITWDVAGLFCHKDAMLTPVQCGAHHDFRFHLYKASQSWACTGTWGYSSPVAGLSTFFKLLEIADRPFL